MLAIDIIAIIDGPATLAKKEHGHEGEVDHPHILSSRSVQGKPPWQEGTGASPMRETHLVS
jgi:hypothetical protein